MKPTPWLRPAPPLRALVGACLGLGATWTALTTSGPASALVPPAGGPSPWPCAEHRVPQHGYRLWAPEGDWEAVPAAPGEDLRLRARRVSAEASCFVLADATSLAIHRRVMRNEFEEGGGPAQLDREAVGLGWAVVEGTLSDGKALHRRVLALPQGRFACLRVRFPTGDWARLRPLLKGLRLGAWPAPGS